MKKSLLILFSSILTISLILLTKIELQINDNKTTENINLYDINSGGFSQEKFSDDIHLEKSADAGKCTWAWEKSDDTEIDEKTVTVNVTKLIANYDSSRFDQITVDSNMELKGMDPAATTSDRILQITMRMGENEVQQDYGRESKNGDFVEQWAYDSINILDNKIISLTTKLVEHAHNGGNGNFNKAGKGTATLDFRNLQIHIPKLIFDLTSLGTLKLTKLIVVDDSTIVDFLQLKNDIVNLIIENLPNYLLNNDDYTIDGLTDYVLENMIDFSKQSQNTVMLEINSLPNSGAKGNCQVEFTLYREINLIKLNIEDLVLEDLTVEKIHKDIIEYVSFQLKQLSINLNDVELDLNYFKEKMLITNNNILEPITINRQIVKITSKSNWIINSAHFKIINKIKNYNEQNRIVNLNDYKTIYYETNVSSNKDFKLLVEDAVSTLNCGLKLVLNQNIIINNENEILDKEQDFINEKIDSIELNIIGKNNVTGNLKINIKNSQYKNIINQKTKTFYTQIWFYFLICTSLVILWTVFTITVKLIKKRKIKKTFNR